MEPRTESPNIHEPDALKEIKAMADQSKPAVDLARGLVRTLRVATENRERAIIKSDLKELENLPKLSPEEKRKMKESIENLGGYINEREQELASINELINNVDRIMKFLEVFSKRLRKITFDESGGFLWRKGDHDNVSKLVSLTKNILKIHNENVAFFSDDENSNKLVLGLYHKITDFCKSKSFRQLYQHGESFGYSLDSFFKLYLRVLQLLSELNSESKLISTERKNVDKFKRELTGTNLSIRLNAQIKEIQKHIAKIVGDKERILKELEIVKLAISQVIVGLRRDEKFLKSLFLPKFYRKLFGSEPEVKVSDPYYLEAKSSKSFFNPIYGSDSTGVFDRKESYSRLFEEYPLFDNNRFYSMNDDINGLTKEYFSAGDGMINDFKGYYDELLDLVSRSPKLDPHIKGILIIPMYQEAKVIRKTLELYSRCSDIDKIAIILFENMPAGTKRDLTLAQVQLFKLNNPNVKIYHIFKSFRRRMPLGYLRKYITEYGLLLKHNSNHPGNLILIGGDADVVDISNSFLTNVIDNFVASEYLDAVEMRMDFPVDYRMVYPNLWVMHRIFDYAWMYVRGKNPHEAIRMYGPASAIKASSYLMIKGYNPRTRLCEDLQLSWLLDEGRRGYKEKKKVFAYLLKSRITTNPRRAISAYLSEISFLDLYDEFEEKEEVREMGWEEIVKKEKSKGILNVGNTFSSVEIRKAIEKTKLNKSDPIAITLAYGLQRYVDWWQFKVEKSRWITVLEFEEMLKKIMLVLGIDYQFELTYPHWSIVILNVDKLIAGIDLKLQKSDSHLINISRINSINYNPHRSEKSVFLEQTLILIGHTSGGVGEIGDAKKMLDICRAMNIPCVLFDIFEFFPRSFMRDEWNTLADENWKMAEEGKIITDPQSSKATQESFQKVQILKKMYPKGIIWFVTYPWNELSAVRMGFLQEFPTIGMYYPHDIERYKGRYSMLLKAFDVVSCLTPVAMISTLNNEVPKSNILLGQHKYSYEVEIVYKDMVKKRENKKVEYIKKILAKMGKIGPVPDDVILIGSISRLIEHYQNSLILKSLVSLCRNNKNVFLLFKGSRPDKDVDNNFYALLNEYQNEPWLLFDNERSDMPEIFEIYASLDLAIFAAAVGNASAEIAGVGTPLLLSHNSTNVSLYSGIAEFFFSSELADKVQSFLNKSKSQRNALRKATKKKSSERFSPEVFGKKIKMAMEASSTYFHADELAKEKIRTKMATLFDSDMKMFDFKYPH